MTLWEKINSDLGGVTTHETESNEEMETLK